MEAKPKTTTEKIVVALRDIKHQPWIDLSEENARAIEAAADRLEEFGREIDALRTANADQTDKLRQAACIIRRKETANAD